MWPRNKVDFSKHHSKLSRMLTLRLTSLCSSFWTCSCPGMCIEKGGSTHHSWEIQPELSLQQIRVQFIILAELRLNPSMACQDDTLSHTGGPGNVEGLETNKCHVSWPACVSSGPKSLNLVHPAAVVCDERRGGQACSPKYPASTWCKCHP